MPTYGDEKRRNMARSVLPSTHRKGARDDARYVHGRTRARVREALHKVDQYEPYYCDEPPELFADPQRLDSWQGIKTVVYDRRNGDKLGALIRWAEQTADRLGDAPDARCAALRAMLPQNIIGWHAMTHVDRLDGFDVNPYRWSYRRYRIPARSAQATFDRLVRALNERLDRLGELNAALKRKQPAYEDVDGNWVADRRLWGGRHDTEDFARWALSKPRAWGRLAETGGENGAGWSHYNGPIRTLVNRFCDLDDDA